MWLLGEKEKNKFLNIDFIMTYAITHKLENSIIGFKLFLC
jgi:hypothetical protein